MQLSPSAPAAVRPVRTRLHRLCTAALLGAVSAVLMSMQIPVPFAPPFYNLDFAEVPALVGALFLGPAAGAAIETVKVLLKLLLRGTTTAFWGDFVNWLGGILFLVPTALLYRKVRERRGGLWLALGFGFVVRILWACFCNAYISLPMYASLYGWPMEQLIAMGTAVNPAIQDLPTFIVLAVLPFNLLKAGLDTLITALLLRSGQLAKAVKGGVEG